MEKVMDAVAVRVDEYGCEIGKERAVQIFKHHDHVDMVFGKNGTPIAICDTIHDVYMGIEVDVRGKYYYVHQQ